MIEAAEAVQRLLIGVHREDLDDDLKLRLALVRAVEIIGEAANNVSADVQSANPEIPWRAVIATRNRLIHAYFDLDLDFLWSTAVEDVPKLLAQLKRIDLP